MDYSIINSLMCIVVACHEITGGSMDHLWSCVTISQISYFNLNDHNQKNLCFAITFSSVAVVDA